MRSTNRNLCAAAALAILLSGCSSVDSMIQGDKIDYRSQSAKTSPLEVPPDLSQLQRESRYQPQQSGVVSAATYQNTQAAVAAVAPSATSVAPRQVADMRIVRDGNQRWLVVPMPPEKLWPLVQSFWEERGFVIQTSSMEAGTMETDWAENRGKIPEDWLRRTIGKVFDQMWSTGERDKFRTRIERTDTGSEVYISHKGVMEVYAASQTGPKDQTTWTNRPSDPNLEAQFLALLMNKLGAPAEAARAAAAATLPGPNVAAAASAPGTAARARIIEGPAAALRVDEGFDRAWRRVGLTLDRSGFSVEDRDRANGLYYVRYADPKYANAEEPGFFSKLFGGDKGDKNALTGPNRYRIQVKGEGPNSSLVTVLNPQGQPDTTDVGSRIVKVLVDDLK